MHRKPCSRKCSRIINISAENLNGRVQGRTAFDTSRMKSTGITLLLFYLQGEHVNEFQSSSYYSTYCSPRIMKVSMILAGHLSHGSADPPENSDSTSRPTPYEFEMGPRDIQRVEGETDEFIPCPYVGEYEVAWVINGTGHTSFNLPDWCISYAFGLLIKEIKRSLNNTSFLCRYPTGRGFETSTSSKGILTVVPIN